MKFLVLALCVCAASAATIGSFPYKSQYYKPTFGVQAVTVVPKPVIPKAIVPKAVVVATIAPAVVPVAKTYKTDAEADVVRSTNDVTAEGYNYSYETQNGISAEATGVLKNVDDSVVLVSQGGYSYYAPDGTPVVFKYVADENGYQPQSDLLPVGPEIPEAIVRSLEYIAARTQ